jgi:hypothetical protein
MITIYTTLEIHSVSYLRYCSKYYLPVNGNNLKVKIMSITIYRTPSDKKRSAITSTLKSLNNLPKTAVLTGGKSGTPVNGVITISSQWEFLPDFNLEWCDKNEHYRVYIYVSGTPAGKVNAGYCIFVIPNALAAAAFTVFYSFIHKNRANNKI